MECGEGWETLDQATLDAEYNAAGTVPSLEPYFARYRDESARVRNAVPCVPSVPYGGGERRRLDVFPASVPSAPILIFFHGGYWRRMSKDDFSFVAEPFVGGATVVIPSYSLAPSATVDDIVHDAREAVLWVARNGDAHNGDPTRIVLAGHSAGAQLAGMLAAFEWESLGLPASPIAAVCGISGLYDLTPVRCSNCNDWLRLDDDAARRNSPILHLPRVPMPLVAAVGERETSEFQRQTLDFAVAWRELGYPAECTVMTALHHYDIVLDLLRPTSALRQAIVGLLERAQPTASRRAAGYLTSGSTSLGASG